MTRTNGSAHTRTGDPELDDLLARAFARWMQIHPREWESVTLPFHVGDVAGMPAGCYGSVKLSVQPLDPRRWEPPIPDTWLEERE